MNFSAVFCSCKITPTPRTHQPQNDDLAQASFTSAPSR